MILAVPVTQSVLSQAPGPCLGTAFRGWPKQDHVL